jgi:hypothetical protein
MEREFGESIMLSGNYKPFIRSETKAAYTFNPLLILEKNNIIKCNFLVHKS